MSILKESQPGPLITYLHVSKSIIANMYIFSVFYGVHIVLTKYIIILR